MDWLSENWVWVLIGVAFVGMHLFGHGGHGGGGRESRGKPEDRRERPPAGHQH